MTYDREDKTSPVTAAPRGRKLLTDYSKFKAPLAAAGPPEHRPRLPSPNHRSSSRSRSRSRGRGSLGIPLEDDQFRLERPHRLETEIQRIEFEIDLEQDQRLCQSEYVPGSGTRRWGDDTGSDTSIGVMDLEDDDSEDLPVEPDAHQQRSLPLVENANMFLKKQQQPRRNSASFHNSFGDSASSLTRLTREDLRADRANKIVIQTRRRSLSSGAAATSTAVPMPGFQRSKTLEVDPQDPSGSTQLRRFRRQRNSRNNSDESGGASTHTNWHNSTGQISFRMDDVTVNHHASFSSCSSSGGKRRALRRSKSNVDDGSSPTANPKARRLLPLRSKTYSSYTTTHGKNADDLAASSNHGFLTGSRIKRHHV